MSVVNSSYWRRTLVVVSMLGLQAGTTSCSSFTPSEITGRPIGSGRVQGIFRLTLTDGSTEIVTDPRVVRDTVFGLLIVNNYQQEIPVARSDVRRIEKLRFDRHQTFMAAVATVLGAVAISSTVNGTTYSVSR